MYILSEYRLDERPLNPLPCADKEKASQTNGLGLVDRWWNDVVDLRLVGLDGNQGRGLQVSIGRSGFLLACGHVV